MGEIGKTYSGLNGKSKSDFGHGEARYVTYMNVFKNPKSKIDQLDKIEIDSKQNLVKKGDVLFTTSSETPEEVGMSSVWDYDINNVYLNSFCFGYRPIIKFGINYLSFVFRSASARKKIILLAQGISRYNISKNKMMDIFISIPRIDEQTKIGSLFQKLDQLLTLHERKLELLKELKKAFLQLMFPDKDETVPKLRFKGFNDEWEQRKLNDIASYKSSKFSRTVTNSLLINGKYPLFDLNKEIAKINTFDQNHEYISIAKDGSIGKLALRSSKSSITDTMAYIKPKNSNLYFLYYLLHKFNFNKFQSGSIIPHIYFKDYGKVKNYVPDIDEQTKIGSIFQKIVQLLTNQECKLEKLKLAKNFFLQKMFI